MQRHINIETSNTETIKAWILGLIRMKKKDQKLKPNDIRLFFELE